MSYVRNGDVILFQGDSITDGNRGRKSDPNHILGHGYQFILASEISSENIDVDVEFINRGISGNRIENLYGRWREDTLLLNPTVLSILIGVNDAGFEYDRGLACDSERFEKIYRLLLDEALANNPDLTVVIMEPFFGVIDDSERDRFFDEHVHKLAASTKKVAQDYKAVFVPLQEMFDSYKGRVPVEKLLWDGVHPTYTGHGLITKQWKEYVLPVLEKRK